MTLSQKERVGNTAADNQGINQRSQMLQNGELRGNLGTADDSNQRTFGFGNSLCQSLDFFGKQRTSAGDFGFAGQTVSGGLSAVSGSESVVNVDIAKLCHLLNEFGIVFLLADIASAVFKNHDFTRLYVNAVEPVFFKTDRHAEHLAERFGNFSQTVLFCEFAFLRTTQVRADHHAGAALQSHLHGRHGFFQAMVISNVAFCIAGNIHVGTNKNTLSFKRAFID